MYVPIILTVQMHKDCGCYCN